jgi:hypothetical protein
MGFSGLIIVFSDLKKPRLKTIQNNIVGTESH